MTLAASTHIATHAPLLLLGLLRLLLTYHDVHQYSLRHVLCQCLREWVVIINRCGKPGTSLLRHTACDDAWQRGAELCIVSRADCLIRHLHHHANRSAPALQSMSCRSILAFQNMDIKAWHMV
jgi:hypothetical protein